MGLKASDLRDLVYNIFEIDSFKSKMGDDKDIVTLSFSVKEQAAAEDLMNFLEKGYDFVLDADVTKGEQSDGTYKVFVELERDREAVDNIMELADGVQKVSGLEDLKFRYYKNFRSVPLSSDRLQEQLPLDPDAYDSTVTESNLNNYTNFFNRSFVESVDMWDDIIRIKKAWADPVFFEFIDFGDKEDILNNINESLNVNDFSEIIYLSKYIGDYNITKYGSKLTFENEGKTLVVERIQT